MNSRMAKPTHGKYDEVIDWLKIFESSLQKWAQTNSAPGMFTFMAGFNRIQTLVMQSTLTEWSPIAKDSMQLAIHWQHVTNAWDAIVDEMEGGARMTSNVARQHCDNVHAALRWFEKNNERK